MNCRVWFVIRNGIDYYVNMTARVPISGLRYDVDKGLYFFLEFNIHFPLTSQMKVGRES